MTRFKGKPAIDPATNLLVKDGSGQVYAVTDTSFASPLEVTDTAGLPLATISTGPLGIHQDFDTVADHLEVVWKSGPYTVTLESSEGIAAAAAASAAQPAADAAATAAVEAASATFVNKSENTTLNDAQVRGVLDDQASAARQYLDANFAQVAPDPTGTDDAAALNTALSSGAQIIDGRGRSYLIASPVTVPAGVTLTDCRITLTTPGMNGILVADDAKVLKVHIVGTGTTSITERGIFPATAGASDVELDVTVENMTVGVNISPLTAGGLVPKRWHGTVRARHIVGTNNASEGYGLLMSPATHCRIDFDSYDVKRHSVYLSAGASHNTIRATTSRNDHAPVQLASYVDQPACQFNTIDLTCDDVANTTLAISTFGLNLVGKVSNNTARVTISDSPLADGAVLLRSLEAGAVCRDNDVTAHAYGTFVNDVIKSDEGLENVVELYGACATATPATWALIGVRSYNGIVHTVTDFRNALRVRGVNVNALGTASRALVNSQSTGAADLGGRINVHATTANPLVSDFTAKVRGFAFEETLQVVTASIEPGASGSAAFTFGNTYNTQRVASISATQSGVTGVANAPELALQGLTATGATVAVKNNTATAGTLTVRLRVAGY